MKAKLITIAAALSFLLFLSAVPAFAQFPTTCSNILLYGDYGFTVNGKIIPPEPEGQTAFVAQQGVALQHFFGDGTFKAVDFIMTNGVPAINPSTAINSSTGFRTNERGTYTVNPDCTGSLTLNQYTKFNTLAATIQIKFVLVKGGKEIREVVTSITANLPCDGDTNDPSCVAGGIETVNVPATILANGKKLGPFGGDTD